MTIFGMGPSELLIIAAVIVALFVFGPKNLPKLGKSLGKTVKSVREGMDGKYDEDDENEKKEETAVAAKADDVKTEKKAESPAESSGTSES